MGDYEHCLVGIMEEAGEIAGWYKKANYYGIGMTEEIGRGLKGELGDLLYYLTKLGMLTEVGSPKVYQPTFDVNMSDFTLLVHLNRHSLKLMDSTHRSDAFIIAHIAMLQCVKEIATRQGWSINDIMYTNVAKLKHRHGNDFDVDKATPSNRDIVGEDGQLEMSLPTPEKPKKKSILKSLRKKAGFNQSQVATVLGVSTSHICMLEKGEAKMKEKFVPLLVKLYKCPKNIIEQYA